MWALIGYDLPTPITRMTYRDAMEKYGSDKPDLRFGCELVDLTDYFKDTTFRVFQNPYVGAVVMPGGGLPVPTYLRRLAGVGQAARRQGSGLRHGRRGRDPRRARRQEHHRR